VPHNVSGVARNLLWRGFKISLVWGSVGGVFLPENLRQSFAWPNLIFIARLNNKFMHIANLIGNRWLWLCIHIHRQSLHFSASPYSWPLTSSLRLRRLVLDVKCKLKRCFLSIIKPQKYTPIFNGRGLNPPTPPPSGYATATHGGIKHWTHSED